KPSRSMRWSAASAAPRFRAIISAARCRWKRHARSPIAARTDRQRRERRDFGREFAARTRRNAPLKNKCIEADEEGHEAEDEQLPVLILVNRRAHRLGRWQFPAHRMAGGFVGED